MQDLNIEQLVQFCAYFTFANNAIRMPIIKVEQPTPHKQPKSKIQKVQRKKLQVVPPKKVVKPKMEIINRPNKKSVSPINKDYNQKPDLDYFISYISGKPSNSQLNQRNYHQNDETDRYQSTFNKISDFGRNYQTFGKTQGVKYEYEPKNTIRKENTLYNKGNLTDRTQPKQQFDQSSISYIYKAVSNFKGSNYAFSGNTGYHWDRQMPRKQMQFQHNFQTPRQVDPQSILLYSNSKRDNTPIRNIVESNYSPERSLTKSKSTVQRKNSERPLYNPNQVPAKTGRDSNVSERSIDSYQGKLTTSSITRNQPISAVNKKMNEDEMRRDTSATVIKIQKNMRTKSNIKNQMDLDDQCENYLQRISEQRKTPVPIEMGKRQKY